MNPEISNLQELIQALTERINTLENEKRTDKEKLTEVERAFKDHNHSGNDGSLQLRNRIRLDKQETIKIGDSEIGQTLVRNGSGVDQFNQLTISSGLDPRSGFLPTSLNLQLDLIHQYNTTVSYIRALRPPIYSSPGTTSIISTTSGGTTATPIGFIFTSNELAGCIINIYDSSGTFVESQVIASNTTTTITIAATWLATTTGGFYVIFYPVYLGISEYPFQRVYVNANSGGGVRFGIGTTNGGQNGLLFSSDVNGQLYYRDYAGVTRFIENGSNLTAGRVPFAGVDGILTDDADMTFATDTLTVTKLKIGSVGGYKSNDGSSGATGSFVAGATTVTVKDGLITSIV